MKDRNLYRSQSVRESIHEDMMNHECFFDENAFAEHYDIDGHKVLGLMLNSRTSREYDPDTGTSGRSGLTFICRCDDVKDIRVNNIIRIDGKAYYVNEARRIQGMYWKIELTVNE